MVPESRHLSGKRGETWLIRLFSAATFGYNFTTVFKYAIDGIFAQHTWRDKDARTYFSASFFGKSLRAG